MDVIFSKFDKNISIKKQRELFIECFPENINTAVETEEHYNWKFHNFPTQAVKSFEYTATLGEDIVGYYAALPYQYEYEGNILKAGMVCDVMTGIKARGKGIFTKLGIYATNQLADEGLDFTTGYPIRPEVIPGHIKAGWEVLFDLPLYGKFLKADSLLKSRNIEPFKFFVNPLIKAFDSTLSFFHFAKNKKLYSVSTFDSDNLKSISGFDIFLENINNDIKIGLIKNEAFLNWRLGAPERKYLIVIIRKVDQIIGYAIVRDIIKENVPTLAILDFFLIRRERAISNILIQEICRVAKSKKCEFILIMIAKYLSKEYQFFRNGFLPTPYKFSFILKLLNTSIDKSILKNVRNWHLMWIDSDDL